MEIKTLFDSNKDIYRNIEKVITYGVSQEDRLRAEISEYVVTDSIEDQFEKLLRKMQDAMEAGGQNEVGVWVSGFYGSGKSSFTKYLGLAFDDNVTIDGTPFIQYLEDRLQRATTKALLNTVAKRFPAAVMMLDLASEQLAGATMEEVSTVLYYKVLQWAGYSRNLKVAAFERKLKKDNRHEEFQHVFKEYTQGLEWSEYRNDELIVDSTIPSIAHQMYPEVFKTESSLSTEDSDFIRFENDRVEEMIEIAREASGKEHIIFIVDEVGQYVGSKQDLILNLDGLAKNLKNIGDGKVWLIGTAQQTLTEDDPKASLNSPELYKLKDRFPIQIDLEANDIKEICYRRLLSKSAQGEQTLGDLFDKHGQALRNHTKLENTQVYGTDFDKQTFINLYPFLPAHFDILLHLLGALAKSTGGFGLRSAIKVVQDILVGSTNEYIAIANQPIGWLASTVTIYDALRKDIEKGAPSLYQSVQKVIIQYPNSKIHQEVAKTVCVLQVLGNLPITTQNISGLMQSSIDTSLNADEVKKAVNDLISNQFIPFGEKEGSFCFFSEKLNDIEQDRANFALRNSELQRIQNEALKEAYKPLPSAKVKDGVLVVSTGLKSVNSDGREVIISGHGSNAIQTVVELVDPQQYENIKERLIDDSRQKLNEHNIYLIGRKKLDMQNLAADVFRCMEVANKYRNEPDQEVKEYCASQGEIANRKRNELERLIKGSLLQGSFIFRGEVVAVDTLNQNLTEAANKHLCGVAEQVYNRHSEAAHRAQTNLAEKFLGANSLSGITSDIDPLGLVKREKGTPTINVEHKALISIRDIVKRQGSIEGSRLLDIFADAPYGWSQDTIRYLVAAMLYAGEIKVKSAGREILVTGQHAIDALKNNISFKKIGISLRDERPSRDVMAKASDRLTELSGNSVVPLENEISKATTKLFPALQHEYAPLAGKLTRLSLQGVERLEALANDFRDILSNDGSDAPTRLGAEDSELYNSLKWAAELDRSFKNGLDETLTLLQLHKDGLNNLPDNGIPGQLKSDLAETLESLDQRLMMPDFYKHSPDFASALTEIKSKVAQTVEQMLNKQSETINSAKQDLRNVPEWSVLNQQEQDNAVSGLDGVFRPVSKDIEGLKALLRQDHDFNYLLQDIKANVVKTVQKRQQEKVVEEQKIDYQEGRTVLTRKITLKPVITSMTELNQLINELKRLQGELQQAHEFELNLSFDDTNE